MSDDYLYLSYEIWVRVWHDGGAWRPWHAIVGAGPMQYGEAGSTTYAAWTRAGAFRKAMRFAGKQVVAAHVRYLETGELPPAWSSDTVRPATTPLRDKEPGDDEVGRRAVADAWWRDDALRVVLPARPTCLCGRARRCNPRDACADRRTGGGR